MGYDNHNFSTLRGHDPLKVLADCNGYYECPKDRVGNRLGPLVGYAGKYASDPSDPQSSQLQYVGDVYCNFAAAEQHPLIYRAWASRYQISDALDSLSVDLFLGAPMGGIFWAYALADRFEARVAFAEKKTVALATSTGREQSKLVLTRHVIETGERVAISEDVCNNFSTTSELFSLVQEAGGIPVCVICLLNRSEQIDFKHGDSMFPVLSLVHKPFPQYRQDDPAVAADIARGNVVWKPKNDWQRLKEAQQQVA